jgi:hypothetical protein
MEWTILANRLGADKRSPTYSDIELAVKDLHDNFDDTEHGSICLCRGKDGGPLYTLELSATGTMIYSHYADSEFDNLVSERMTFMIGIFELHRRFEYLLQGPIEELDLCQWEI